MRFFSRNLTYAEQEKVVVCLENMPFNSLLLSRPEEILDFVKEFNSPYFNICLDTGHCNVQGISPADAIRKLGKDYVAALHIHDNNGADDHLNLFEGSIDWKDFSEALHEIDFDGVASLETTVSVDRSKIPNNVILAKENVLYQSVKAISDRLF